MNKGFTEKGKIMILKICVEIEMPDTLADEIADNNLTFGEIEDGMCQVIVDTVEEVLPLDTCISECYPLGWGV